MLRTLVAASSAKTAGFGVPSFVPKWRSLGKWFSGAKTIGWEHKHPYPRSLNLKAGSGSDPFAADARSRALAPETLRLRRDQIHAAASALVECGTKPASIRSLADLVTANNLKTILRRRLERVGGEENSFNHNLGRVLLQIAREWVKVDPPVLAELKRLVGKMPVPAMGLTDKNKRFLRQFDDPRALLRLVQLPEQLWSEVKRDSKPSFRTLAKAHAALAIAVLTYIPLRMQNADSDPSRTVIPAHRGQRSGDCGQFPISA